MFEAKHPGFSARRVVAATAIAVGAMLAAVPAQALVMPAPGATASLTEARTFSRAFAAPALSGTNCRAGAAIEPAAAPSYNLPDDATKSAAILGGAPSALELIRLRQSGLAAPAEIALETATELAPQFASAIVCDSALSLVPRAIAPVIAESGDEKDNFLGSTRIEVRNTSLARQWRRVSGDHLASNRVTSLVHDNGVVGAGRLQLVNRWVNRSVTYAEDRRTWGRSDYWATASETLSRRAGDCEDLAILKYQMLLAMGVDADSMYLTLVRDLVRNADHAVLVVREQGRFYLLDNATDVILPASLSYDYRPTLSFSGVSSWLHGAPTNRSHQETGRPPVYLSVNATSRPRVTGFSR